MVDFSQGHIEYERKRGIAVIGGAERSIGEHGDETLGNPASYVVCLLEAKSARS